MAGLKRSALKRMTGLKRGTTPLKRTTRLKAVSAKRRARLAIYRTERDAFLLAHPTCCWPGCSAAATELHHARGRENDRLTDTEYFRGLCHEHHLRAHSHPLEAKECGVSVSRLGVIEENED